MKALSITLTRMNLTSSYLKDIQFATIQLNPAWIVGSEQHRTRCFAEGVGGQYEEVFYTHVALSKKFGQRDENWICVKETPEQIHELIKQAGGK